MTDYTQQFLDIENAAHDGAFGHNIRPTPTDRQCEAGNYKVGRVQIYGMPVSIEQPRNSYRTGTDKSGQQWRTRMAAHYGYFTGTRGADGDPVDCFIGPYPQAETAWIINQHVGGAFDEHKVMICFPDEQTARRAYLDSYDRGWNGLHSMVTASISQLRWWLKNGNLKRPLKPEHLPYEGLETMNQRIIWDSAQPQDYTFAQLLYHVQRADGDEGLILDSVNMADIMAEADEILVLDALVTPYARLQRKMEVLQSVMERIGGEVKPVAVQVSEPYKQGGVAQVAAVFELSDGQTISIFFHNPDVAPAKIGPTDELISWKWMLNKKDITIVVAPEKGDDLNVKIVAERIIKLAEKNSAAFQRANTKRAENMAVIESLKAEIPVLEKELSDAQKELELVKFEADNKAINDVEAQKKANEDFAQAVYQSLIDDYGWQNQGMDGKPLSWVTKTIGGGRMGGVVNPNGDRRVSAKVQGDKLVAMWGDNPLVSVDIDREAGAKANAGKLDAEVNAEDPRYVAPAQIDWSKARELDTDAKVQALGVARIDEIGSENVYIEKDGKPYYMKPPGTGRYSVGEYDFSNEVVFGDSTGKIGDPTSPEGYAKIKGNANMELRYQDVLDSFFQSRIAAVWQALKAVGWEGTGKSYDSTKNGFLAKFNFKNVGAGANVVGYWVEVKDGADTQAEIGDNLTGTPEDVAAQIDAVVTNSGQVTKDNYPPVPEVPQGDAPSDQSQTEVDPNDMRGLAFAIEKDGKLFISGSVPKFSEKSDTTDIAYYKKIADQVGGNLYVGGISTERKSVDAGSLILGMTWEELQARQRKEWTPEIVKSKMPKDAVLVYSAPASDPSQPHIDTLQSIVDGNSDGEDLDALLDKIDAAASALEAAGLAEQYDELIGQAATKWALIDKERNG